MNFQKDRLFRILRFREITSVFVFTFNPRLSRIYVKVLDPFVCHSAYLQTYK